MSGELIIAAPARYKLVHECFHAGGGEAKPLVRMTLCRIGIPGGRRTETERFFPRFACRAEIGCFRVDVGIRSPRRPTALDRVGHEHIEACSKEEHLPSGPTIWRRFPVDATHSSAMP